MTVIRDAIFRKIISTIKVRGSLLALVLIEDKKKECFEFKLSDNGKVVKVTPIRKDDKNLSEKLAAEIMFYFNKINET